MDDYSELIAKTAETFRVDANLLKAIITIESSWIPTAVRHEPKYSYPFHPRIFAERLGISEKEEEENQKTSWGLGQVMGAVCREYGFTDKLEMVLNPEICLFYMGKHLKHYFQRYESEDDVISAYNAGHVSKTPGGMYSNQTYVDKVCGVLRSLRTLK